ncbi:PREDICTED: armadillo repeat-containing protein 7 isoform X3 [Chinchilla lanigera]|uniref:armadillo repeat-containing protein 7 isoform X3 n=1 Tax=Chinchilla lanigera TaxID=34839 RepID=UPI000696FF58|nr:PREDICTED: armadillo repeat-containing protein 7 isoform X3 [Chinchilla lanigera]
MAQKPKVEPHIGRLGYLQALVTEFQETESQDAKEQVLANLANFAYDPSNYQYLRQLQVLDLFLDSLSEDNESLVEFAIAALTPPCTTAAHLGPALPTRSESVTTGKGASATCVQTGPTGSTFCRWVASRSSPTACPVPTRRPCCRLSPRSCT